MYIFLNSVVGPINPPPALQNFDTTTAGGLIVFISNLIKFGITIAGIYAFVNLILAGYQFMSSGGDPKGVATAWAKIYQTLIGIIIIATSMLLTAIISMVFFGDAQAIFNVIIYGP